MDFLCIIHVFKCGKITIQFYRKFFKEKKYIIFFPTYAILCIIFAIIRNFIINQNLDYDD